MNNRETEGGLPLTPVEEQAEKHVNRGDDMVKIPVSRYEDLIRTEAAHDIVLGVIMQVPSYSLQRALYTVLGLKECDLPHA